MDRTANLLGTVALAVAERINQAAREIVSHSGETPAALVVIGYGLSPSNDELRRVLGLSHPGTVRLVDRLVADGLVERGKGRDKRAVALHLTDKGFAARKALLAGRLSVIRPLLLPLESSERKDLAGLLSKLLTSMQPNDLERCRLCRLCDDSICTDCPIPADFRKTRETGE